jgi:hypothetical protein
VNSTCAGVQVAARPAVVVVVAPGARVVVVARRVVVVAARVVVVGATDVVVAGAAVVVVTGSVVDVVVAWSLAPGAAVSVLEPGSRVAATPSPVPPIRSAATPRTAMRRDHEAKG